MKPESYVHSIREAIRSQSDRDLADELSDIIMEAKGEDEWLESERQIIIFASFMRWATNGGLSGYLCMPASVDLRGLIGMLFEMEAYQAMSALAMVMTFYGDCSLDDVDCRQGIQLDDEEEELIRRADLLLFSIKGDLEARSAKYIRSLFKV